MRSTRGPVPLAWQAKANSSRGLFASDGTLLAGDEEEIVSFDGRGREIHRWHAHKEYVTALALTSRNCLISASLAELKVWDYATRECLASTKVPKGEVSSIAARGVTIVTNGPLALWQLE